ncbi:MAG: hypothetical protein JWQ09_4604 [Segetibacter sp.]|nr:hypothetical protein [Segetibacter sp.]
MKLNRLLPVICLLLLLANVKAQEAVVGKLIEAFEEAIKTANAESKVLKPTVLRLEHQKTIRYIDAYNELTKLEKGKLDYYLFFYGDSKVYNGETLRDIVKNFDDKQLKSFIDDLPKENPNLLKTYRLKKAAEELADARKTLKDMEEGLNAIKIEKSPPVIPRNRSSNYDANALPVQKELRKKGYKIRDDGIFGKETNNAVAQALNDGISQYKVKKESGKVSYATRFSFNNNHSLVCDNTNLKYTELRQVDNFYKEFYSRFSIENKGHLGSSRFITLCPTSSRKFVGFHSMYPGENGCTGRLSAFNPTEIEKQLKSWFTDPKVKRLYVYGNDLSRAGRIIRETAAEHNVTVVYRNTAMNKTFNETEAALNVLGDKKLDAAKVSFLNGTPTSAKEAIIQGFPEESTETLKSLGTKVNEKAAAKTATFISGKKQLMSELTTGSDDVLFIVGHCDKEYIYFGSERLSIKELEDLPKRTGYKKPRTAILLSCNTADIHAPFINRLQSFSEILIEKNFFHFVIAPPAAINGDEILRMMEIIDKYPVLELPQRFNEVLGRGAIIGTGEIFELLPKRLFSLPGSRS